MILPLAETPSLEHSQPGDPWSGEKGKEREDRTDEEEES